MLVRDASLRKGRDSGVITALLWSACYSADQPTLRALFQSDEWGPVGVSRTLPAARIVGPRTREEETALLE